MNNVGVSILPQTPIQAAAGHSRVPCATQSLLVGYPCQMGMYSSMYMAIPNSIPYSHSSPWQPKVHFLSLLEEAYEKGLDQ